MGAAAEVLEGNVLTGDALYDVGARYEHVARLLDHEYEVRDRRRVQRRLRRVPMTEIWGTTPEASTLRWKMSIAGQGDDALLDSRPARVVDPDNGTARGDGEVHDLADLLRVDFAQRPPNTVKSWENTQTLRPETSP